MLSRQHSQEGDVAGNDSINQGCRFGLTPLAVANHFSQQDTYPAVSEHDSVDNADEPLRNLSDDEEDEQEDTELSSSFVSSAAEDENTLNFITEELETVTQELKQLEREHTAAQQYAQQTKDTLIKHRYNFSYVDNVVQQATKVITDKDAPVESREMALKKLQDDEAQKLDKAVLHSLAMFRLAKENSHRKKNTKKLPTISEEARYHKHMFEQNAAGRDYMHRSLHSLELTEEKSRKEAYRKMLLTEKSMRLTSSCPSSFFSTALNSAQPDNKQHSTLHASLVGPRR